jgi:hypothetical protein
MRHISVRMAMCNKQVVLSVLSAMSC